MSPDTYVGLVAIPPLVGLLAFGVVRAARDDVRVSGSASRAFWHPGVLLLVAVATFITACVLVIPVATFWVSVILFVASTILAASAGLSLELRRGRPGIGVVAFVGVGLAWFFGAGFIYLIVGLNTYG